MVSVRRCAPTGLVAQPPTQPATQPPPTHPPSWHRRRRGGCHRGFRLSSLVVGDAGAGDMPVAASQRAGEEAEETGEEDNEARAGRAHR